MPGLYPVKVVVEVGYMFPLHSTAPAKAIMAFLPETEREALIDQIVFEKYTVNTITGKKELSQELEKAGE